MLIFNNKEYDLVFNSFVPSITNSTLEAVYKRHENEKRRSFEERVREVEPGSFTPLVVSATGGMGIGCHSHVFHVVMYN